MSAPDRRREVRKQFEQELSNLVDWGNLLSKLDPYSEDFCTKLRSAIHETLRAIWTLRYGSRASAEVEIELRQNLVLAQPNTLHYAQLLLLANSFGSPTLKRISQTLISDEQKRFEACHLSSVMLFAHDSQANRISSSNLSGGLIARLILGKCYRENFSVKETLAVISKERRASLHQKSREFDRFIQVLSNQNRVIEPFKKEKFHFLDEETLHITLNGKTSFKKLAPACYAKTITEQPRQFFQSIRNERKQAELLSQRIETALIDADFTKVNFPEIFSYAEQVLLKRLRPQLNELVFKKPNVPPSPALWRPLEALNAQRLLDLTFPDWVFCYTLSLDNISKKLETDPDFWDQLPPAMSWKVASSWSEKDALAFIDAGKINLVSNAHPIWETIPLDNAIAHFKRGGVLCKVVAARIKKEEGRAFLLDQLSKSQLDTKQFSNLVQQLDATPIAFLGNILGSEIWKEAGGWNLHLTDLKAAISLIADQVSKRKSLRKAELLLDGLVLLENLEGSSHEQFTIELLDKLCIQFGRPVAKLLKVKNDQWAGRLLSWSKLSVNSLLAFEGLLDTGLVAVWQQRVLRETSDSKLKLKILKNLDGQIPLGFEPWQAPEKRSKLQDESLAVFIISYRDNLKKLSWALKATPEEKISSGCIEVASILRQSEPGISTVLELSSCIGFSWSPRLIKLMGERDKNSEFGRRFDHLYFKWQLPKKSGGNREISAPDPILKSVQKQVLTSLLYPLGAHECAHGFVPNRGILSNALIHKGQPIVTNLDVKDCFSSVKWPIVRSIIKRDLGFKLSPKAQNFLTDIITSQGALPTGAPTSPALLNRVLLKADEILITEARKRNCNYSRYADDLTFSGDHGAVELLGVAKNVLNSVGLALDEKKTNIFRRGRRQMCTGLVVNVTPNVPRRLRKRLRAAVHAMSQGKKPTWHGREISMASLRGHLEYHRMISPEGTEKLIAEFNAFTSTKNA